MIAATVDVDDAVGLIGWLLSGRSVGLFGLVASGLAGWLAMAAFAWSLAWLLACLLACFVVHLIPAIAHALASSPTRSLPFSLFLYGLIFRRGPARLITLSVSLVDSTAFDPFSYFVAACCFVLSRLSRFSCLSCQVCLRASLF